MTPEATWSEPDAQSVTRLLERLCSTDGEIIYFPVRHHSPLAASLLERLIRDVRPDAVLIEGPSDFNEHWRELLLDHQLPIAIYSYCLAPDGTRRGAYYPFCEYSPEWRAVRAAADCGISAQFIDLPWRAMATAEEATHRYGDAELRRGRYVSMLCERLEVEDFDSLWDQLIEANESLMLAEYLRRVHSLCVHIRLWEARHDGGDARREAYMAERIRATRESLRLARDSAPPRLLVVTGGFHCSALAVRMGDAQCAALEPRTAESEPSSAPALARDSARHSDSDGESAPPVGVARTPSGDAEFGIALTTYSYERLDSLTGYDAGLPNPGFYDHVWQSRTSGKRFTHEPLLRELVVELRKLKQTVSTADWIGVETAARGLAQLRGRSVVWRRDLVDGVTTALIKDELEYGAESPFLRAVQAVLRGRRRGKLAEGTRVPPLVADVRERWRDLSFEMSGARQEVALDLLQPMDRERSRFLHRLSLLMVRGAKLEDGVDFVERSDLTRLWERWTVRWSADTESSCLEASRYGTSLVDAAAARLAELARNWEGRAAGAAELLVRGAQAGLGVAGLASLSQVRALLETESKFSETTGALAHLIYLYCFEEAFGTRGDVELGAVVRAAFDRSLWLLELLGKEAGEGRSILRGMRGLLDVLQRTEESLELGRDEFVAVLDRVERDSRKSALVRGASAGALWSIGQVASERILADLLQFVTPTDAGDFLAGLFALAREVAQRQPEVVRTIDRLLLAYSAEEFDTALPSLRIAFTYFTPREKHYLLSTLFDALGLRNEASAPTEMVDAETAAAALAWDSRIDEALRRYGLDYSTEERAAIARRSEENRHE